MLVPSGQVLLLQISVGLFQGLGSSHSQPLHQPILRGAEAPLDAPLGRSRMCGNPGNAKLPQSAA
jgi:hypothetical protein